VERARQGYAFVVVSAVSFGGVAVLGKLALARGLPVDALLFWRWLLAAAALAPLVALRARGRLPTKAAAASFALGAVGYAGTSGIYFLALPHVDAAVASFLLFLSPVLVAVLSAALLRERVGWRLAGALGLAVGGLGLLAFAPGTHASALGVAYALGSAVVYAGTVVTGRKVVGAHDPLAVSLLVMAGAAASFGALAIARGAFAVPAGAAAWREVVALAVVSTALSIATFYLALPLIGAARAALASMLEPVSTAVVAWVVLGEVLRPVQFVGAALILCAVGLVVSEGPAGAPP